MRIVCGLALFNQMTQGRHRDVLLELALGRAVLAAREVQDINHILRIEAEFLAHHQCLNPDQKVGRGQNVVD